MTLQDALDTIIGLLSETEASRAHFAPALNRLHERKNRWSSDSFIIGLVGVTGSGKSSVLNALMGEKLLPEKVKPSTNVLTQVRKGERKRALVKFRNNTSHELACGELTKDSIGLYADEANNPDNHKNVDNIEVEHPDFLYDRSILIIDSPGLDAYGHQYHETITLEQMIPLLDCCIIVLPLKPNSDSQFLNYIRFAVSANKPVIILQNMKDGAQPAREPDGTIRKTREKVLEEHMLRIKAVVTKAGINTSRVHIIQFSAHQALESRQTWNNELRAESGLNHLERVVSGFVENRKPTLERERLFALRKLLNEQVLPEQDAVNSNKEENSRIFSQASPEQMEGKYKYAEGVYYEITGTRDDARARFDAYLEERPGNEEEARKLITDFGDELGGKEEYILNKFHQLWGELGYFNEKLLLGMKAYKGVDVPYTKADKDTFVLTRNEQETIIEMVDPGFIEGAWRLVTFRSYEKPMPRTIEKVVYNHEVFPSIISQIYNQHQNNFLPVINTVIREFKEQLELVRKELPGYRETYERRRSDFARSEEILSYYSRLREIVSWFGGDAGENPMSDAGGTEIHREEVRKSNADINPSTYELINAINGAARINCQSLFNALFRQSIEAESGYFIAAGWNSNSLQAFASRFLGVSCDEIMLRENLFLTESYNDSWQVALTDLQRLESEGYYPQNELELFGNPKIVVILLNPDIYGNTMKTVMYSPFINGVAARNIPVIAVMDTHNESDSRHPNGELPQAHLELVQALAEKGLQVKGNLVNSDNPLLSHLLHEIMIQTDANELERMEIIKRLENLYTRHYRQPNIESFEKSLINLGRN